MPTAKFIHDGNAIDYRPTTDVAAGDVIVTGNLVGIAKRDIPANMLGALAVTGVFEMGVLSSATVNFGDQAWWDENISPGQVHDLAHATPLSVSIGVAVSAPFTGPAGDTRIFVRISNPARGY